MLFSHYVFDQKMYIWICDIFPQPMVLMRERSWQDLGSMLGEASYPPSQYESKDTLSEGNHQKEFSIRIKTENVSTLSSSLLETECGIEIEKCEESLMTPTEATSAPSGPSGLVIFGQMVQKHSYVSGLIIMMVNILSPLLHERLKCVSSA